MINFTPTKEEIEEHTKGGKDNIENLQTMCEPCNTNKGNKE